MKMSVRTGQKEETCSLIAVVLNLVEKEIFCGPFKMQILGPYPRIV